jgi:hypothetical protein
MTTGFIIGRMLGRQAIFYVLGVVVGVLYFFGAIPLAAGIAAWAVLAISELLTERRAKARL